MTNASFDHIFDECRKQFQSLHIGRANPALCEDLPVEAYGAMMRLQELATLTTPEAHMLLIQPWDTTLFGPIANAIRKSPLGFEPIVDGDRIRIAFPPLTEEKRNVMVKTMHGMAEEARIKIRQLREEILKGLKNQEKEKKISEDEYFRKEKEVQKMVDTVTVKIAELSKQKEEELLHV